MVWTNDVKKEEKAAFSLSQTNSFLEEYLLQETFIHSLVKNFVEIIAKPPKWSLNFSLSSNSIRLIVFSPKWCPFEIAIHAMDPVWYIVTTGGGGGGKSGIIWW